MKESVKEIDKHLKPTYITSNHWKDLISPGINTGDHSQTRSQQEQHVERGQGEKPGGESNQSQHMSRPHRTERSSEIHTVIQSNSSLDITFKW